jgi:hypothetical protein
LREAIVLGCAQSTCRFDEANVFGTHDERHDIAANVASEAMPGLTGREHDEIRAAPVGMEWTPASEASALLSELDPVRGDYLLDGVRQLESGCIDPPRAIGTAGDTDGHAG